MSVGMSKQKLVTIQIEEERMDEFARWLLNSNMLVGTLGITEFEVAYDDTDKARMRAALQKHLKYVQERGYQLFGASYYI